MNDSSEINVIGIRDCDINIIKIDSLFYLYLKKLTTVFFFANFAYL